ncbi:preprotein translocase subunit YajC [Sphingomonas sp. 28-63-12]|uniref:preprotein translocase subunit YajC n=1 Tax=Sphingomonas sp. 28-63-12 TaxID=1970434 RepID=UPI000BD2C3DF|nr:MAG: preprotein translocase subunit YajC [Sphingomonas sp. 28-63-12]
MLIPSAFAQTAGAAADGSGSIVMIIPYLLLLPLAYFLLIRPQQQRMKKLQDAVNAVKKGDEVTTAGGIIGKVTKIEERIVEIEIAAGVKVKVVKATLAAIAPSGAGKPAND